QVDAGDLVLVPHQDAPDPFPDLEPNALVPSETGRDDHQLRMQVSPPAGFHILFPRPPRRRQLTPPIPDAPCADLQAALAPPPLAPTARRGAASPLPPPRLWAARPGASGRGRSRAGEARVRELVCPPGPPPGARPAAGAPRAVHPPGRGSPASTPTARS